MRYTSGFEGNHQRLLLRLFYNSSFIFLSNNYFGTPLSRRFLLTHFSLITRIQKIEDNILRGEEELTLHSADGSGRQTASSRVRDIVTTSFSSPTAGLEVRISLL